MPRYQPFGDADLLTHFASNDPFTLRRLILARTTSCNLTLRLRRAGCRKGRFCMCGLRDDLRLLGGFSLSSFDFRFREKFSLDCVVRLE